MAAMVVKLERLKHFYLNTIILLEKLSLISGRKYIISLMVKVEYKSEFYFDHKYNRYQILKPEQ